MNIFELRYDYKVECEFIGDNEDDSYSIVFKVENTKQEWCKHDEISLYLCQVEDLIDGLDQLKSTLEKAIEK